MNGETTQTKNEIEIVEVPFYGDLIEAARDTRDGSFHVSIRRVCDNLGIDYSGQLQKLKGYHWATICLISTVAQDDKTRELTFLPVAQVPMWLTTIHVTKVDPAQAEKLKHYQLEAVDVLYKHFVGPQPVAQDPIVMMAQAVIAVRQAQLSLETRVDKVEQQVDDRVSKVEEQIGNVVELRSAALNMLRELPRSQRPAKPLTTRAKINMLIRQWVNAHGLRMIERGEAIDSHEAHAMVWQRMYREFKYRYGFDAVRRAENDGISKLDAIEQAGMMEDFFDMVSELLS